MTMMITSTIAHRAHRIVVDITMRTAMAREPQVAPRKTLLGINGTKEEPLQRATRSYKRPV